MERNLILGLLIGVLVSISVLSLLGIAVNAYYGNMMWNNQMMGPHGGYDHNNAMQHMHDECEDMMNEYTNSTTHID
ncbi:MAG TPA: hypothetical protein VKU94_04520 [Geobacterales bacterium]|nr:hypothetical protein [Geobacterales bacterium]